MTTANASKLYQETILTLNKKPLNYGILPEKNCSIAECHNPHCGDSVKLFVKFSLNNSPKIKKIVFNGESCAVTRASASLMTENLKDKNLKEIKNLASNFSSLIDNPNFNQHDNYTMDLGNLSIFNSLNNFPSRKMCALLPWKALEKITNNFIKK
jgi:nitrogen fixation NifU-like protein